MTGLAPGGGRLGSARATLPAGALELACHAAVPVAIDPGFLHLLRINFFLDPPLLLPYPVEADLLASPLFRELGAGLYEIDRSLRNPLLISLVTRFGSERLARVAMLLEQYTDHSAAWRGQPELEQAQRLTALSAIDPAAARDWLDRAQRPQDGAAELSREWFVAMRGRLKEQPPPELDLAYQLAEALDMLHLRPVRRPTDTLEGPDAGGGRLAAVHRLGQLGLLPGADSVLIAQTLADLAEDRSGPVAEAARTLLATLLLLVPPPTRSGPGTSAGRDSAPAPSLPILLGIGDPAGFEPRQVWGFRAPRPTPDQPEEPASLRVPIGVDPDHDAPVVLDLDEAALGGSGPHGLLIGTTGSGKTELLLTLLLALAVTHPPNELTMLLVDPYSFSFKALAGLPHLSGQASGLLGEIGQSMRLAEVITGELTRRQNLLAQNRAGNYRDYRRYGYPGRPELPRLLIVIDEYNEVLTAFPALQETLVRVARVGRSLGVHLLLSGRRTHPGTARGLDTLLSYRIGLRMDSESESREVLGIPDAYRLPRVPGHGFLVSGGTPPARFRASNVSMPYRAADFGPNTPSWDEILGRSRSTADAGPTVADVLVQRLAGAAAPAELLWLPPLATPLYLVDLLDRELTDRPPGTVGHDVVGRAALGLVDRPFERRQDVLWLDPARTFPAGNFAVVGQPRSGKSALLMTLICSVAIAAFPSVRFYILDFGGGTLGQLAALPQVGSIGTRRSPQLVRRMVFELHELLARRRDPHRAPPIGRPAGYNFDPRSDVLLVIDGWARLHAEFEDLEAAVTELVITGPEFGIHVLASANRWSEFRGVVAERLAAKLELRLADPAESAFDRRAAAAVPNEPGHGITPENLHFLAGTLGFGDPESDPLSELGRFLDNTRSGRTGLAAPPIPLLPPVVPAGELAGPDPAENSWRLPIGLGEVDLGPVYLDFEADPHLLVFGDPETGKTALLRLLARGITQRYRPEEAVIMMVDYRRGLVGEVDPLHLLGYATGASTAADQIRDVAKAMRQRLPSDESSAGREWRGPRLFLLIDDYELVTARSTNPLAPLLEALQVQRDIGLHLVIARRSDAAQSAVSRDPILSWLRELRTPGIQLSSPHSEGQLWHRPVPQPHALEPGRGWLVGRRGSQLVQLGWLPPDGGDASTVLALDPAPRDSRDRATGPREVPPE